VGAAAAEVPRAARHRQRTSGAGYTGTIAQVCKKVSTPKVGDAVLYGRSPYLHVCGVIDPKTKLCVSHGSNSGPNLVKWDYRGDMAGFWRPDYSRA
jgi:hypothetical protein